MEKTKEEWIKRIIQNLRKIDYIKPDDIPNIDLYMDQVTTFMDRHLQSSKRHKDDKMLTKTMINNYTKNNLLPSPNKKKYSKEHMLLLIFIYYFKNFLTINDIQTILNPLIGKFYEGEADIGLEEIYKEVFSLEEEQINNISKDILKKYSKANDTFKDVKEKEDHEYLTTFSFICMLSFDVYVKKMIIEKLVDQALSDSKLNEMDKKVKKDE